MDDQELTLLSNTALQITIFVLGGKVQYQWASFVSCNSNRMEYGWHETI
jgi:hypothetical protein